jgi:hypothetical protein
MVTPDGRRVNAHLQAGSVTGLLHSPADFQ